MAKRGKNFLVPASAGAGCGRRALFSARMRQLFAAHFQRRRNLRPAARSPFHHVLRH